MKRKLSGILALLMFALIGMTSCNKEKDTTEAANKNTNTESLLIGSWRFIQDDEEIFTLTFNNNGFGFIKSYDWWDEQTIQEMFQYTYNSEENYIEIQGSDETGWNTLIEDMLQDELYGGRKSSIASFIFSIIQLDTNTLTISNYKASSGNVITMKRV